MMKRSPLATVVLAALLSGVNFAWANADATLDAMSPASADSSDIAVRGKPEDKCQEIIEEQGLAPNDVV